MTSADAATVIERSLAAPLADARTSGGAVGYVGPDVPIELLLASGRPFGHLPWRANGVTPWADRWLESSFPFWARSILEQWHAGAFDALDTVVFSRGDDASQRLFYYVTELKRRSLLAGPTACVFDIALLRRETSVSHTADAILELGRVLGVTSADLPEGIDRANRLRRALAEIETKRDTDGPFFERLSRAVLWTDPTQWIDSIGIPQHGAATTRVLLAGSVPPDDRLHFGVEALAATVVAEAHVHGLSRLGPTVRQGAAAPERVLASHLQRASVGPRSGLDRSRWIVERAVGARADAVLIWLTQEDEAYAWHVPAQRQALEAAGIRVLILPAARWQADDDTFDRIAEFLHEAQT